MKWNIPDLDVDCSASALKTLKDTLHYIPANRIRDGVITPHACGVYPCDIPIDPVSQGASIDYKEAEEQFGYMKIDLLHNTVYDSYASRTDLCNALSQPIKWSKLMDERIVMACPHIRDYYSTISKLPPIRSILELAMLLAVIRPAKKYLQARLVQQGNWDCIIKDIWTAEKDGYQFKKAHAVAYAISISLFLRDCDNFSFDSFVH